MALNLKVLTVAFITLGSVSFATAQEDYDENYYTISSMEVTEVYQDVLGFDRHEVVHSKNFRRQIPTPDPIDRAGKVISVTRDLVALGEDLYRLVIKGKPSNTTTYAPISVVPMINGVPVDPMDIEGSSVPTKRTYQVVYKNIYNADVVTFRYSVMWSYGGSYQNRGSYLTNVQIIPESARTLFGFDFTATMKLGGIQNLATRDNHLAGATILLEYTVSSAMVATNVVVSYFVTGKGGFKKL